MKVFTVALKEEGYPVQGGVLTALLADEPFDVHSPSWRRPAVLVIPGGAYAMTSKREAEPIALEFLARGFHAFILHYQTVTDGVKYPEELVEVASAMDYIKKHARKWCINKKGVFAVGFSAGGHLVGNLSVAHQNIREIAGCALDCKPTGVGLCYPVISQKYKHQDSHINLLNGYSEEEKQALYAKLNLDENVTKDVPPTYLWTTATDRCVPAQNTLSHALALAEAGVPYELHVFAEGEHGLATGSVEINAWQKEQGKAVRGWLDECATFFRRFIKEQY